MIIKFGDDADTVTMGAILSELAGWTIELKSTNPGLPETCSIDSTNRDEIIICEVDEIGRPLTNQLYRVGYDEIVSITVI